MRRLLLGLIFSVALCLAHPSAEQTSRSNAQMVLKDNFAKSSIRLLKMIESETGYYDIGSDGGIVGPRSVQQTADGLDADAQTKGEQMASKTLQVFLDAHLSHNTQIEAISAKVGLAMVNTPAYQEPTAGLKIAEIVSKSPTVIAMHAKESACSTQIESLLRARKFHDIVACKADVLAVPNLKTLDVAIQ